MTGIFAGSTALTNVTAGSTQVQKVFVGATLIWAAGEQIGPPVVVYNDPAPAQNDNLWVPNGNTSISQSAPGILFGAYATGEVSGTLTVACAPNIPITLSMSIGNITISTNQVTYQILDGNNNVLAGPFGASEYSSVSPHVLPATNTIKVRVYQTGNAFQGFEITSVVWTQGGLQYIDKNPAQDDGSWLSANSSIISQQPEGIRATNPSTTSIGMYRVVPSTAGKIYGWVATGGPKSTTTNPPIMRFRDSAGTAIGTSTSLLDNQQNLVYLFGGAPGTTLRLSYDELTSQSAGRYISLREIKYYQLLP